jgi:hypothetical protein
MPITARYPFIASMDVDPDKEDLFNEVYDILGSLRRSRRRRIGAALNSS